jgi:hypothetical protein
VEKIRTWLNQCEHHETCNQWAALTGIDTTMPTQLLKLTTATNYESPKVTLVFGEDLPPETTLYATFSHCWGKSQF